MYPYENMKKSTMFESIPNISLLTYKSQNIGTLYLFSTYNNRKNDTQYLVTNFPLQTGHDKNKLKCIAEI